MANLDPATLEKFKKFQAILAQSPEIVEALNSPEILALAAKAVGTIKPEPELKPAPQPEYPVVGYGVSDEVSVLSEMTTPTVMTRQTVEEDEFYPEVDGIGVSSSGLGPRRIGLKIGVSAFEGGRLPPPPPKSKTKNAQKMRHGRAMARKTKAMAPMSKIVENDASVTTAESTESNMIQTSPLITKKSAWNSKMSRSGSSEKLEPHPFLGRAGAGTVKRHNSTNSRNRRTSTKPRGVNRNRSMPNNMKLSSSSSASSDSLHEDDNTKTSGESNSTPSAAGSSDPSGGSSSSSSSSSTATNEILTSEAGPSLSRTSDDRDKVSKSRGRSVPRMRLVPVVKSIGSADSNTTKTNRSEEKKSQTRSRSLSKKAYQVFEDKDVDNRRSSALEKKPSDQTTNVKISLRDDDRDEKDSESSNTKSEDSKVRTSVTRRWKPPSTDNSAIPPAFRSSGHSKGSRGGTSRSSASSDHLTAKDSSKSNPRSSKTYGASLFSKHSQSEEQQGTGSEDHTETPTSSDDESDEDYVRQTVRKPGKAATKGGVDKNSTCRPDPQQFKQYLSEITQVIRSENSIRPSDFLPGSGSPFTTTRKKKVQLLKKKFNNPSDGPRSGDWLGSGKIQKRSWHAK